jgi:D-alanyl-D-alanine carboxypeptidase (penicillin-binding protein 5/6)
MMRRYWSPVAILAALTLVASPVRAPAPATPPQLTAEAWIAEDVGSGAVVLQRNADEERAMASVTKLMTALVVRDHAQLDERVRVSEAAVDVGESEVGLVAGEVWSVRDLLAAMLVRSGNDAAYALAEYVGGTIENFAELMNEKAAEMGLVHSHFMNPHGLDADGHYTTARDLAKIAEAVLADDVLSQFVRTGIIRFKPAPDGTSRIAVNTNHLLNSYPGVIGMKTGYTSKAGRVLVTAYEVEDQTFVIVVMGSEDHFGDTAAILDYITQRLNVTDRFLSPLVQLEGGGGVVGAQLDPVTEEFVKTRQPEADGQQALTPWGETPGEQRIVDMVRSMLPVVLGGTE